MATLTPASWEAAGLETATLLDRAPLLAISDAIAERAAVMGYLAYSSYGQLGPLPAARPSVAWFLVAARAILYMAGAFVDIAGVTVAVPSPPPWPSRGAPADSADARAFYAWARTALDSMRYVLADPSEGQFYRATSTGAQSEAELRLGATVVSGSASQCVVGGSFSDYMTSGYYFDRLVLPKSSVVENGLPFAARALAVLDPFAARPWGDPYGWAEPATFGRAAGVVSSASVPPGGSATLPLFDDIPPSGASLPPQAPPPGTSPTTFRAGSSVIYLLDVNDAYKFKSEED